MRLRKVTHFFGEEYLQQAQYVNFSKIASVISGNKVTAQKVLSTIMSENINKWQKVEVISSLTALNTLYLGGSTNIDGVVTNIGSGYVGSNNIKLIETKGDFGGRLNNEPAASRYIFAKKGEMFDKYFNKVDLNILPKYVFEGTEIEYAYFTYSLPMILINGTSGLGSGYKSEILPRNPKKVLQYISDYLNGKLKPNSKNSLEPYFEGFNGTIDKLEDNKWLISGSFKRLTKTKYEITDLPIGESYKSYIKKLIKLRDNGYIKGFTDLCDTKKDLFHFYIQTDIKFSEKSDEEIIKLLKLSQVIKEHLVLNDETNAIKVFDSITDIMKYYIDFKIKTLEIRKEYIINTMSQDIKYDISKYTFIKMIVNEELIINKRNKKDIVKDLENVSKIIMKDDSYDYLLNMSIVSLTTERMQSLMSSIQSKSEELIIQKKLSTNDMWLEDLKSLKTLKNI